MPLEDEQVVLKSIYSDKLIFENAVGNSFIVDNKQSTSPVRVVRKNTVTSPNRFQLPNEASALNEFKSMAVALGIPKQIINQFDKTPGLGRDSFGRPGWLLDETIPSSLLQLSPFLKNDLIIAVNGIAINDQELLLRHIEFGDHDNDFDVELERSGELKLIRVRF
jgi:type II secretory pathway component PulC